VNHVGLVGKKEIQSCEIALTHLSWTALSKSAASTKMERFVFKWLSRNRYRSVHGPYSRLGDAVGSCHAVREILQRIENAQKARFQP
jgi:hypothetical protein